jgi:hypothetical protein
MLIILGDKVNIKKSPLQARRGFVIKRRRTHLKPEEWEEIIPHLEQMLATLKFGSITLIVQDGKIIQIEKNEKVRLQQNKR